MKKSILLSAAALLMGMMLPAAEPEQFVPANSFVVTRLNAQMLMDLPLVKSNIDKAKQSAGSDLKKLQALGIEPEDFIAGEVWGASELESSAFFLLIKTRIKENQFKTMLTELTGKNPGAEFNTLEIDGQKVYTVKFANQEKFENKTSAAAYLADDVILLSENTPNLAQVIRAAKAGGKNPLKEKLNRQVLLAVLGDASVLGNDQFSMVDMQLDLIGANKNILTLAGEVTCKDVNLAQQSAMQMQFILQGIVGMIFGKDPQLSQALLQNMQIVPADKNLKFKYQLDVAVLEKVVKYLEDHAKKTSFPPTAVPAEAQVNKQ